MAKQLGASAAAARVAVHRFRKRFRQVYREEVCRTLPDGTDLEAEVRYPAAALAQQ
jgi:RNA polymerase sigma-70 factor (ECF subfamily)